MKLAVASCVTITKSNIALGNNYLAGTVYIDELFSLGANFLKFPKWTHNLGKFILGCYIKFDYGLMAELGVTTKLLHPMQESIKQQNTFTTIAAANVEVIASYCGCYECTAQVHKCVATTSSYSYSYSKV